MEGLEERLIAKSDRWTSEHNHIWSQKELIKDYSNQFALDMTKEIEDWASQKLQAILQQNVAVLNNQINEDIYAIHQEFEKFYSNPK